MVILPKQAGSFNVALLSNYKYKRYLNCLVFTLLSPCNRRFLVMGVALELRVVEYQVSVRYGTSTTMVLRRKNRCTFSRKEV